MKKQNIDSLTEAEQELHAEKMILKRLVVGIREKERVCQDISTEMDGIVSGSKVLKIYNNLEKGYRVVF